MTGKIITVRGEIEPHELGFCQPHEHLYCAAGLPARIYPPLLIDDAEKSAAEAKKYYSAGGRAAGDAQPPFTGRSAEALKDISEASDLHIIASTGFHKLSWYGKEQDKGSLFIKLNEDQLADIFTSEITTGMFAETSYTETAIAETHARTGIRAGQIKTALEREFTETHKKLFSAAAAASVNTGVPVMIHVDKDADPLALLNFLVEKGVKPNKLIFCHIDRFFSDITVHREIAETGAYLEYDTIARPKYHSEEKETSLILEIFDSGFEDNIMMSLDTTRDRLESYGGDPGLCYLLKTYIPELKKRGVSDSILKKVFVANPAEAYTC